MSALTAALLMGLKGPLLQCVAGTRQAEDDQIRTFRRCVVHDRLCQNQTCKASLPAGTHLALNTEDLR